MDFFYLLQKIIIVYVYTYVYTTYVEQILLKEECITQIFKFIIKSHDMPQAPPLYRYGTQLPQRYVEE